MLLKDFEKIESSYINFKINLEIDKPKSWLKTISAFVNNKVMTFSFLNFIQNQ